MSVRALLAHLASTREGKMWSAIRSLTEEAALLRQLSTHASAAHSELQPQASVEADALIGFAERLRTILSEWPNPPDGSP